MGKVQEMFNNDEMAKILSDLEGREIVKVEGYEDFKIENSSILKVTYKNPDPVFEDKGFYISFWGLVDSLLKLAKNNGVTVNLKDNVKEVEITHLDSFGRGQVVGVITKAYYVEAFENPIDVIALATKTILEI